MNKKLIRKMQTAAGGPIRRIKFTPEQIALFENLATRVPGMNNSGGNKYREEGVLALQHLEQEAKRKEEEIKSRMEMRPTLKRKTTTAEKLQGKKDEYELKPQIVGMSGTDPVGEFILAGIGFNGIGALAKTGLWNVAKYAPTTQLGNWGRLYFVGNAFKNSFNGTVPTLASQTTSLLYLPAKLNESGLTSLKFFERKPSRISETERAGVPRGERNVKQGYLLKDAIEEANKFAEKWGYDKLSQNATLLDIENLYNQHNTFFRGVTTEQLENTRNRVAKELGINPELLTKELYLLYVSTHSWPGNDRIWVTPMSHYGEMYGNGDMIGGVGLLSAVMRPWKSTKDIKLWPKLSLWTLGFKEDVLNPVITPWVSNNPNAIRSTGALSEFLIKSPLIYRGLGLNFKGTLLLLLKYNDGQGKLGWIESLVGELPTEIYIKKLGGKINMLQFLKNGSGIHIKKKNRGSFTRWCGGNVTEECIRRGKASSNPKIRKKATFADNVRNFKHRLGGILYFLLEGGNFLNSDTALINGIGAGILYFTTNNQLSKMLNEFNKSMKAKYNFLKNNINMKAINLLALQNIANLKLTNPEQNFGTIDLQLELERLRKEAAAEAEQLAKYLIALELSLFNNLINAIKGENTASLINGIFNIGKTALLNYKPKNNKTNIQTTTVLPKLTTNTYTSNYSLTTPSLGLFNTPLNNSLKFWNV